MHVGKVVYVGANALTGISLCGYEMTILNNSQSEKMAVLCLLGFANSLLCHFFILNFDQGKCNE